MPRAAFSTLKKACSSMNRSLDAKPRQALDPVEIPRFTAAGVAQGALTFTPGEVSNYPNAALLKEAVRRHMGRQRRGTASTKTRGEIAGTNRKPWKQKGTGRARAGTRKSPIWRGGGTVFGPTPRSYDYELPKRQRRLAVRHALLSKLLDGETRVIAALPTDRRTRGLAQFMERVGVKGSCLIGFHDDLDREQVQNLVLACRNLVKVQVLPVKDFNVLALLKHRELLLTEGALQQIQRSESSVGDQLGSKQRSALRGATA